jgi:sirohydrochlorin ferrochelatase
MTTLPLKLAALLAIALATNAAAQTGMLVVAHGAGPEWNGPVRETMASVSWPHGPVEVAFLMGAEATTSGWDSAAARLARAGVRDIVVVPLMVSSYGEHVTQIRYLAGEIHELPASLAAHNHHGHGVLSAPARVTPALDDAPELGEALATRWVALSDADRRRPVLLVAHGPSADSLAAHWITNLTTVSAALTRAGATTVRIGLLRDDAAAPVRAAAVAAMRDSVLALAARSGDSVVALPVMISSGAITAVSIPRDLLDLPVRYSALPLAPLPSLARWIERVAGSVRTATR